MTRDNPNDATRRTVEKIVVGMAAVTASSLSVIAAARTLPGAEPDAALFDAIDHFHAAETAACDDLEAAESAERKHRHGAAELRAAADDADRQQGEALEAVFDVPATTVPGLLAKLHFALEWEGGLEEIRQCIAESDDQRGYPGQWLMLSFAEDLRHVAGGTP